MKRYMLAVTVLLSAQAAVASEAVIQQQLDQYRSEGAGPFTAGNGEALWQKQHMQDKLGKEVNCASCHGANLKEAGSHIKTGKRIEPLAPSVNPERFSDAEKIEKWFGRNCTWTWGRECTAQEKGDILTCLKAL